MRNQLHFFEINVSSIWGSDMQLKSIFQSFARFNIYGEEYNLSYTDSHIHPRSLAWNIYHSVYHITCLKTFLKLFGLDC